MSRSPRGGTSLPGRPLAAAIYKIAEREELLRSKSDPSHGRRFGAVCARAGMHTRVVYAWSSGERDASLVDVDRVLFRLGLEWWNVWDETSVRKPILVVHCYRMLVKHPRRGPYRCWVRAVPYGDLGPDMVELKRVEMVMTGEVLAA